MKKQKKATSSTQRRTATRKSSARSKSAPAPTRRSFLKTARNAAIGAAILGGTGLLIAQNVMSAIEEHDLTRVKNGRATVVQIHDPQCTKCQALQRETRQALKHFDAADLDFVIANIRTSKGSYFAATYGVPHVTLLLFDSKGKLTSTLHGHHSDEELRLAFSGLLSREAQE